MLGFFPDPYPDELFYSICARFHHLVGYARWQTTVCELFGKVVKVTVAMPCRLKALVAALPPGHRYTVDRFIDEHTLFPFYSRFLSLTSANEIYSRMALSEKKTLFIRSGIPKYLQFCPTCVLQDRKQFGECYWHRLHQAPGVKICPVHRKFLQSSQISIQQHQCIAAEQALSKIEVEPSLNTHSIHPLFLQIAHDATWLLSQPHQTVDQQFIRNRYVQLMISAGFANSRGFFAMPQLINSFEQAYPVDCIKQLQCGFDLSAEPSWITITLQNWRQHQHPLRHLLLIHLLRCSAQDFFLT
ncbi:Tn7-like transposition protein D [Crinalium epipsammum PCC 9333]|uniref:Tn7-like transposition protein D n=1 Tax=Crinalium epipsammum PCC 9333 TaxID=1173022 RepID=K9VWS2_9CYAN|nr:TnsD family Tn7-like transposition protein [Crinalium epipsammum]AFZ11258.1 Tn7-like transposition protein D [Crinalium epipsammum PCC 9333]AFZ11595.1 Tn7-like transposition protein D [Crinalium epipsammum PCC 9333]